MKQSEIKNKNTNKKEGKKIKNKNKKAKQNKKNKRQNKSKTNNKLTCNLFFYPFNFSVFSYEIIYIYEFLFSGFIDVRFNYK